MGKDDMIKLLKQNNTRGHCVCAETNSTRIDHFIVDRDPEIILLFIKNEEGKAYWCVIPSRSSLSRLVSSSISKSTRARLICFNCHRNTYKNQTELEDHQKTCFKNEPQILEALPKGTIIKFKNYKNIVKCPIKIAGDFECYQPKCKEKRGKSTEYVSKHKPSGYGICVVNEHEEIYKTHYESHTFDGDLQKKMLKN